MSVRETSDNVSGLEFGTKSETLDRLRGKLTASKLLPAEFFTVAQWRGDQQLILDKIAAQPWATSTVIVRSSSHQEDTRAGSLAGKFKSVANVNGPQQLAAAIEEVIASYGRINFDDQILVQPMITKVIVSGVAFGCDPNTGTTYRVINLDDSSHSTDTVTSGSTNQLRTFYCLRNCSVAHLPQIVQQVCLVIDELEQLFATPALEIEFAADHEHFYLLQCRPVCLSMNLVDEAQLSEPLARIAQKVELLSRPHPYLFGSRTVFGIMPDWNPAEIIGVRPRPLALSLYQELITDNIWAYQRHNYGYKNLRSFPLMLSFGGQPYIDVRVDFNSFVPADLPMELGDRLVNYYLNKLISQPSDHDKVEFAVLYTCYTFDLPERLQQLLSAGFSKDDCEVLKDSLRQLTNRIIRQKEGLWAQDTKKIERLEERHQTIMSSGLDVVSKIYWLIEDCKRYGTLPFAGLARAGFIAVQLMKSLVGTNVLSQNDYDRFMVSLDTVAGRMKRDFTELSRAAFLSRYGHLRPGTYDILSPRYDEEPDRYFDWSALACTLESEPRDFALGLKQLKRIESLLEEHQLDHNILGFFDFIRSAIEGREFAKFVFTKCLSDSLLLFKDLGGQHGFSTDDCSFASIHSIKGLYSSSADARKMLQDAIDRGRQNYEITCRLRMPPLIISDRDVLAFEVTTCEPNFITQGCTIAAPKLLSSNGADLTGRIIFIPNADPGYDWIFSKGIAGLVTMYGGVNSHMAIRAGELGIPSVIGAGEALYNQWLRAPLLQIDCLNRQVTNLKGAGTQT